MAVKYDFTQETPLLNAENQPKYVNSLPLPTRLDATGGKKLTIDMRESEQWLGLVDGNGDPLLTTIWGYTATGQSSVSYPGPTIVAEAYTPLSVEWRNKLPRTGHLLPLDPTYHQARNPEALKWLEKGYVPTVTHLHGGHTDADSDGDPDAWFTQANKGTGKEYVQKVYSYDNDQEAATLWYHDHALGMTRLNVYAGLAGYYLLRDENEYSLAENQDIPSGDQEIELAIQDRAFTADGELFLPASENGQKALYGGVDFPNTDVFVDGEQVPSGMAEFFGDHILVNGMAWPQLDVGEGMYRFRVLNGSDSRFYILELHDELGQGSGNDNFSFYQMGTDSGFFNTPQELDQLVLAPGERADLVVDFAALNEEDAGRDGSADGQFYLRNFGPDSPFGNLPPDEIAEADTTGQIMRFDVDSTLDVPEINLNENTDLRPLLGAIPDPVSRLTDKNFDDGELITRKLALFEGEDEFSRLQPMLGVVGKQQGYRNGEEVEGPLFEGSMTWNEPTTEQIALGDTEVWEIYNATGDAHPIHLHLVNFQVLEVGELEDSDYVLNEKDQLLHNGEIGKGFDLQLVGDIEGFDDDLTQGYRGLELFEQGLKDTIIVQPGEAMRLVMTFDKPGDYVWHCHILSHEDHDMMRELNVSADGVSNYGLDTNPTNFSLSMVPTITGEI